MEMQQSSGIRRLRRASDVHSKRPKLSEEDFDSEINEILQIVRSGEGLEPEQLNILIDTLTNTINLDETTANTLIAALIPNNPIDELQIVRLLACFGRFTHNTKRTILKWLLAIFEFIDQRQGLLRHLYSLFFRLIDFDTLRPFVCLILSRLTHPDDIKPFRIQKLANLQNQIGAKTDANLLHLMQVFGQLSTDGLVVPLRPSQRSLISFDQLKSSLLVGLLLFFILDLIEFTDRLKFDWEFNWEI